MSAVLAFREEMLERILGVGGCMTRPNISKQREGGRRMETVVNKNC